MAVMILFLTFYIVPYISCPDPTADLPGYSNRALRTNDEYVDMVSLLAFYQAQGRVVDRHIAYAKSKCGNGWPGSANYNVQSNNESNFNIRTEKLRAEEKRERIERDIMNMQSLITEYERRR